ncbi:MAG TPA: nucleoside triphosphate pyrophosphohydrolase [Allosphingosinicella sp.]|jgi:predicted house-cleaning noncanonical NTP pyrophosphatase (MazG superfamily)
MGKIELPSEQTDQPKALYHGLLSGELVQEYHDYFVTILNYGSKVAGLLILPQAWVPPFVALPAWLSKEWQEAPDNWVARSSQLGVDLARAYDVVSRSGSLDVIVRSSAVGEGLDDRGLYRSVVLERGASFDDFVVALETIYREFAGVGRHRQMGICLQRYFKPEVAGHVSNEVHLSATRNQWKYEIEFPSYGPEKGLNSKFADPAPEAEPLQVRRQGALAGILRKACHWINLRVDARAHVEWCVANGDLWVVQLDQESPISSGENPHRMPDTHFADPVPPPVQRCFKLHRIQDDTPWKKLNNIRDFWVGKDPPKHQLFYATADEVMASLESDGGLLLREEIDHLTSRRAVIRTDCRDPSVKVFNLPRTHTVDGQTALQWLRETTEEMTLKGAAATDVCFILHRYIPARAAAWSYYSPGDALVRIDCLWGLPDGLQFLSHDSFEIDARTDEELAAEVRFKRNILQEQKDGSWKYVAVARQFGRDRVLSSDALRHLAAQTVAVARRVNERAQIMWFCDLPEELGLGRHLPWYRSRDYLTHRRVERPPYRSKHVRTLADLEAIASEPPPFIIVAQPEADLVRDDDRFLDRVIDIARSKNVPVELPGSTLGHAYYRLRDAGIIVVSSQPKYSRTRGKTAHRKLVRDDIPSSIAAKGETVSFGRLSREDAVTALVTKLFEEGLEVNSAKGDQERLEELADVLEVLRGLVSVGGASWEDVVEAADAKRRKRGGFEQHLVLLETAKPKRAEHSGEQGTGESGPLVSLRKMDGPSVKDGKITIPFTTLVAGATLPIEVPVLGARLVVTTFIGSDGVTLLLSPILEEDVDVANQPMLFDFSEDVSH